MRRLRFRFRIRSLLCSHDPLDVTSATVRFRAMIILCVSMQSVLAVVLRLAVIHLGQLLITLDQSTQPVAVQEL